MRGINIKSTKFRQKSRRQTPRLIIFLSKGLVFKNIFRLIFFPHELKKNMVLPEMQWAVWLSASPAGREPPEVCWGCALGTGAFLASVQCLAYGSPSKMLFWMNLNRNALSVWLLMSLDDHLMFGLGTELANWVPHPFVFPVLSSGVKHLVLKDKRRGGRLLEIWPLVFVFSLT